MKQVFEKYSIPMPKMPRTPRLADIVITPSNEGLPKAWELTTMWSSTSNNTKEARYQSILRADKTAHERFARECRVESELRIKRKQTHVSMNTYNFFGNLFVFFKNIKKLTILILPPECCFGRYKIVYQDVQNLNQWL
jgi:hypothetical protein